MASAPARKGLGGLLRQGWNEIPDVVAGSAVALVGVGLAMLGLANYYRKNGDNRRYKASYVVFRPEDPRADKVHKD